MVSFWSEFGFSETPYRVTPLEASELDYELFAQRNSGESATFLTQMDNENGAVIAISGDIGIGKTSFVNIQQHIIATGRSGWGQVLLPSYYNTEFSNDDTPDQVARTVVQDAVKNIEMYFSSLGRKLPKDIEEIRKWLSHQPVQSGWQANIYVLGFGRTVSIPALGDATLENWRDVLEVLAREVRNNCDGVKGFVVCLDNLESIELAKLAKILFSFRDKLFNIEGIWWVLIGQSGLYRSISEVDRRVSQRITGQGIELSCLSIDNFHELIEKRIRHYRDREDAISPLSRKIHDILYNASKGEIRFLLNAANTLIQNIVANVRESVNRLIQKDGLSPDAIKETLSSALKSVLIDNRISDALAIQELKELTLGMIHNLKSFPEQLNTLRKFKYAKISGNDFRNYDYDSAEIFLSNTIYPLYKMGYLMREEGGLGQLFSLKGYAWLAEYFSLWDLI